MAYVRVIVAFLALVSCRVLDGAQARPVHSVRQLIASLIASPVSTPAQVENLLGVSLHADFRGSVTSEYAGDSVILRDARIMSIQFIEPAGAPGAGDLTSLFLTFDLDRCVHQAEFVARFGPFHRNHSVSSHGAEEHWVYSRAVSIDGEERESLHLVFPVSRPDCMSELIARTWPSDAR